jgi:triosephosphate isomerase
MSCRALGWRQLPGETDEANEKVRAVFAQDDANPLCRRDAGRARDAGLTDVKVVGQVERACTAWGRDAARLVVAYEPIWAIGTGRNALPADAGETIGTVRRTIAQRYSAELADGVRIQYGGSVKPGNIRDFMAHPEIDGALVGGASLDPEEFALIVKYR